MDADDLRAYLDQDPNVSPTSTANLGPYARVVIGRGPTPVKILFRLWLQKFVPGVVPQPLARVEYRDSTTKHEHKANQQKITTQIKEPKMKLNGTNRTNEQNEQQQKGATEWNKRKYN